MTFNFRHQYFDMDVFGDALKDYYKGNFNHTLWLHNSYGSPEEMPVDVFFRVEGELPDLERTALALCNGKTLDIGAGAGSHALMLQQSGTDVTALEISPGATEVMKLRGVKKAINTDIWKYEEEKYDTLLLMMNGIGLVQTINGLKRFLRHAARLVNPGGQLLLDSSDIAYLYENGNPPFPKDRYYGEIRYQYEYKGVTGDWFGWLYADQETLFNVAVHEGWLMQVIYENDDDQYLARLIRTDVRQ